MAWTDAFKGLEYKKKYEEVQSENRSLMFGGVEIPSNGSISGTPATNEQNITKIATAEACINLITDSVAQLPVYLYRETADGSIEKVDNDKRVNLLNHESEKEKVNAIDWKKMMVKDYLLHGQAFSYIGKKTEIVKVGGKPEETEETEELNHLPSQNIQSEIFHDGIKHVGAKYTLTTYTGTPTDSNSNQTTFKDEQLLRVLRKPENPYQGIGVLVSGKSVFEQAFAEMAYTQGIWNNGAIPMGILKTNSRLSQIAIDKLRLGFNGLYQGLKNIGKLLVLEEGLEYQKLQFNPSEMQTTETSKDTDSKICKLFGVPESMISTSANKYNSVSQNSLHFLKHTINPIVFSFESAFDRQLLTEQEKREGYFFRFDTSELLRATEKERIEAVGLGLEKGILTINEGRAKLDLPGIDDDVFMWGLQSVLYNPKTDDFKVPNMGLVGEQNKPQQGENQNG